MRLLVLVEREAQILLSRKYCTIIEEGSRLSDNSLIGFGSCSGRVRTDSLFS